MERKTRKSGRRRAMTRKRIHKLFDGLSGNQVNITGYDPKYVLTYGEITPEGAELMIDAFEKHKPLASYPSDQRSFYDLGSGIGKMVLYMAAHVPAIMSKGIELVAERHEKAMVAFNMLKDKSVKKRIELICGSFMDRSLHDAAWIFVSNLCFSDAVCVEMAAKLAKEVRSGTLIVSSKSFSFPEDTFETLEKCSVPMTWNATHELHMYRRK
jgi:hypothetical protein